MSTPTNSNSAGKARAIPSPRHRATDDTSASTPIRSPARAFGDGFGHASPALPNIPPRIGSPSAEPLNLASTSPQQQRQDSGNFGRSFNRTMSIDPPSRDSASLAPPSLNSGLSTPSNLDNLDSMPFSDERKARIIERHLARPDANRDSVSIPSSEHTDESYTSEDAHGSSTPHQGAVADGNGESPSEIAIEGVDESYIGPHQMQGGAITDDVYRWAHKNRRVSARRTRSESLHMPRTATIDPELDVQGIKEPGGFRRFFVVNRAEEQGRPAPRALRSFIDFLSLYGHFAGEFLEEDDDDDDDEDDDYDDDDDDDSRAIPGTSRGAGNGDTENSGLLRRRRGLQRNDTQARMRKASKERRRGEATVLDAVMMLLKSFVGTGVLFLGKAFFNGGLLFSTITLCSVAIISLVSFLLLVKTNLNCPGSFGDMGGILYGPRMRLAILASIVLSQLGFVAAYTVFVAQNMQAFVLAVTQCKTLVPVWALILGQMAVFLPLSLIRRIAKLSTTALIADVFILFGIVYLFQYEIAKVAKEGMADVVMFNSKDFPLFIGTAVFTFEGIGLVIPITESMKEPEKFPRALTGVMAFVMVLFASAGALSYMAFGSEIQTVVITNLPQTSRFVQAMQFLYSIAILLSTPLQLFPALAVLEKGIFNKKSGKYNWKVKTEKNLFRFLVVAVSCLAAWAGANDLDKFVSLIGSVACVPLCFIYPPLLHLKANATRTATKALNYAMLFFGIVCVVFAGSQTIKAMLESSKPSGPPKCSPR